jgi:hypothetical protein
LSVIQALPVEIHYVYGIQVSGDFVNRQSDNCLDAAARPAEMKSPAEAGLLSFLRWGRLSSEEPLQIVEELDLHAMALHNHRLLDDGKRIVPGPVDNETGREAR